MTDHLTQLLRSAAQDREDRVLLASPAAVLRQGRLRRRRRTVLPVALAAGVVVVAAVAVLPGLQSDNDRAGLRVLGAAEPTVSPDRVPEEAELRAAMAAATPPLVPGKLLRIAADDPKAVGLWGAPGRRPTGDALSIQSADDRIGIDWQRVNPAVTGDEVDRIARASIGPSSVNANDNAVTILTTGVPQTDGAMSRTYATVGGFNLVYAWSPGGGIVAVRGGLGAGPDPADGARMERLARAVLGRKTSITGAIPSPATTTDTGVYLDRLYGCLNAKGYDFTKGPEGGWSGQTSPVDVPYAEGQRKYQEDEVACQRSLGVNLPGPAASQAPDLADPCKGETTTGFELSLVSSTGGARTAQEAAEEQSGRSGWRVQREDSNGTTLVGDRATRHALRGSDNTWQVDSGTDC